MIDKRKGVPWNEVIVSMLRRDPPFAVEYLRACMEDDDGPDVLMPALRHVAEAFGGVGKVAAAAGLTREHLYRALSAKGNPTVRTLQAIVKALGMTLQIAPAKVTRAKKVKAKPRKTGRTAQRTKKLAA